MNLKEILHNYTLLNKDNFGTDKNTIHSYIDTYDRLFESFKDKNISLLEIGIREGASLFLWNKYFSNISITGIDNDNSNLQKEWNLESVEYIFTDAYKIDTINSLAKLFDIIIDDGPHTVESQCFLLKYYISKLKPNGILIIEDIQNIEYIEVLKNILPSKLHNNIEIIDLRSIKNRYDDILFIYHNKQI